MAESIHSRSIMLASDLDRLGRLTMASSSMKNNENNGGRENNNGTTAHENNIGDIVGGSDGNNNNDNGGSAQCAVSMNDLMEIVKRQQSLIVDMAASMNATANGRMATRLDAQEDTAYCCCEVATAAASSTRRRGYETSVRFTFTRVTIA